VLRLSGTVPIVTGGKPYGYDDTARLPFGALTAVMSLALVTLASVLVVALPGYLATGVPPAVALQD